MPTVGLDRGVFRSVTMSQSVKTKIVLQGSFLTKVKPWRSQYFNEIYVNHGE